MNFSELVGVIGGTIGIASGIYTFYVTSADRRQARIKELRHTLNLLKRLEDNADQRAQELESVELRHFLISGIMVVTEIRHFLKENEADLTEIVHPHCILLDRSLHMIEKEPGPKTKSEYIDRFHGISATFYNTRLRVLRDLEKLTGYSWNPRPDESEQ